MRSVWVQVTLLTIYLVLIFLLCRILDLVLWYQHGISSTQIVDPLLLSVRQLKQLLENRGVSYAGYVEKKDLAQLVEASAVVVQSEVEELSQVRGGLEADKSTRERLPTPPPPTRFKGGPHFYEEVEDTKDSVWLVQVVPYTEPLLDDYSWRTVCSQVAPFAIRTGVLDCRLDRRLCSSKGWHYPLLLLALPKGTRAKDRVVLKTYTATRPQTIVEWVQDHLSIRVKSIRDIDELNRHWLQDESAANHTSSASSSPSANSENVKVLLLSHLINPPLFLAALSIKFTGRIKFGMFSIKKEDSEALRKKLKMLDLPIPSYVIITPERTVVYGRRRSEHFNFSSMNLFLRTVHPEMNDVFLCSLLLVNMLVILQIFQFKSETYFHEAMRTLSAPTGTNGGVTIPGLAFSLLGGTAVGVSYYLSVLYFVDSSVLAASPPQWPLMLAGSFAGLVGSLLDSILGATLQYSGLDEQTGCIVEHAGKGISHISGIQLLDNHSVNLISSVVMGLMMPRIANLLWP